MAVCGCCWICGAKFDCAELRSCGDCTEHKPFTVQHDYQIAGRICGLCERDVNSGALGALANALRAVSESK